MKQRTKQSPMALIGTIAATIALLALMLPHLAWAAAGNGNEAATLSATQAADGLVPQDLQAAAQSKPSVTYRAKAIGQSWQAWSKNGKKAGSTAKKAKALNALALKLASAQGSVHYQVHVAGTGWTSVKGNGSTAAAGKNRRVDAVRIALSGEVSKTYSVTYRINSAKTGWQEWKQNGGVAGAANSGADVRAIQVKLVKRTKALKSAKRGIVGVRYRVNSKAAGWSNWASRYEKAGEVKKHKRLVGLQAELEAGTYAGTLKYRVHLSSGKWKSWRRSGTEIGPNERIDALEFKLTGEIAQTYDVVYRAYVQGIGWQRRMRNGETAGVAGGGKRIESLRIKLVPKKKVAGWINDNGTWSYYRSGKALANTWLDTNESPIDTALSGQHRYWLDANGALAVNRFVNPQDEIDAKAKYTAYAGEGGFARQGKITTPNGIVFADKKGKLSAKTGWMTTKTYDGSKQIYRLVKKGSYSIAKTGIFKVSGKKYYAWEDDRGYLMRSTIWWVDNNWYKADAKGVLKNYNGKTALHIERYVKWAVKIAKDDSHGYSQAKRWGPDYDCSSFVCSALLAAGFADSGASWTGNMKSKLKKIGFVWHKGTSGLRRGDIMLVHSSAGQHTEIYLGKNRLVGAHISETGGITGKTGDQTGNEISVRSYYNYPWQGYLRYKS